VVQPFLHIYSKWIGCRQQGKRKIQIFFSDYAANYAASLHKWKCVSWRSSHKIIIHFRNHRNQLSWHVVQPILHIYSK
jgi:hypothetical protein